MICKHCGTPNEESVCVCADCGMPLQDQIAEQTPAAPTPKKTRKRLLFIIGGAVLTVALALLLIFGIRTPKSTVNKALEAIENGDAKAIMKLYPKELKKGIGDKEDQLSYQKRLQAKLDDALNGKTVNLYIREVYEEDEVSEYVLDGAEAEFYARFGHEIEIDAGVKYEIVVGMFGDNHDAGPILPFYVYKISGNWYILPETVETLIRCIVECYDGIPI